MKIIEQDTSKLVLQHQNILSKTVFIFLIISGVTMLAYHLADGTEALLWIGVLILAAGLIGYPFLKSTRLSLDKDNKQIILDRASMIKKQNHKFNYNEVDDFTLKKVITDGPSGEYGNGTTEYFHIMITKKNGESETVFLGNSATRMQKKLDLILQYFTKSII